MELDELRVGWSQGEEEIMGKKDKGSKKQR